MEERLKKRDQLRIIHENKTAAILKALSGSAR